MAIESEKILLEFRLHHRVIGIQLIVMGPPANSGQKCVREYCRHFNHPSVQCCTSVISSSSNAASAVATLLGLDLTGLEVDVGLSCSPITVIGNNCGGITVVCDAPDKEWGKSI
ncbi:hypothetical protein DFH09DRAFT_1171556 [Mycena vulgaris]|nr:hypothetical protein DFH09DRAFT_1171556 [Mycena vulgaris]